MCRREALVAPRDHGILLLTYVPAGVELVLQRRDILSAGFNLFEQGGKLAFLDGKGFRITRAMH
jgi:hypothetical protein